MPAMLPQVALLLAFIGGALSQSAHTSCAYVEDNFFTCDYTAMTSSSDRPIDYASFSPEPQSIAVTMNGLVPYFGDTRVFTESFSGINTANFDNNYPATLTIDCGSSGGIYMYTGAFSNMTHIQHLKIKDCQLYEIPAQAFEGFQDLDYFGIENGNIDSINPNAWIGLNVEKLSSATHSFPRNLGKFEILYTTFPTTYVPPGLLYNMKNLTSATLKGVGISMLTSDVFRYNTKIRYIDIGENDFTSIPAGLFENLDSLSEFRADNIEWTCSCSSLWFVPYSANSNITLVGAFVCSNGQNMYEYYYSTCVTSDVCGDMTGFAVGKRCVGPLGITALIMALAAISMVVYSLVTMIILIKQQKAEEEKKIKAIGRWNQIIDSTLAWKKPKESQA